MSSIVWKVVRVVLLIVAAALVTWIAVKLFGRFGPGIISRVKAFARKVYTQ